MKKFNEIRQTILPEAYKQVEVDWDQDRPDREMNEATVELQALDPKDSSLLRSLKRNKVNMSVVEKPKPSNGNAFIVKLTGDTKGIKSVLKTQWDGEYYDEIEEAKESVDEALGNTNPSHREKPKMDKDGTVHNIPGKKGGLSAYSIKPRIDGNTITFGTVDQEGNIKVMSVKELAKVLK